VTQKQKAEQFRKGHFSNELLITPNAWDAVSAKIYEVEGFKCVASGSAGVANALGIPDGERMTIDENLSVVKRIVDSLDIPVTADMEACYTNDSKELRKNVKKIIDSGVVGINIEDSPGLDGKSLHTIDFQVGKLKTIRSAANGYGFDLFINARIDAWMFLNSSQDEKITECLERANAYLAAGADSVFIPDLEDMDEKTVHELVKGINAPLNIIAGKNTPPISRLQELGVKRVSLGPRPMRSVLSLLRKISKELKTDGTYNLMNDSSISYGEINKWFSSK
jgi:2-methylisocitrate lyase-like PEP mutase family enzyme